LHSEARRQLLATLPQHLQGRSAALLAGDGVDTRELDRLVAEAVATTPGPAPTDAEQLQRNWNEVEARIRPMDPEQAR
jgi:hypothetical protein